MEKTIQNIYFINVKETSNSMGKANFNGSAKLTFLSILG